MMAAVSAGRAVRVAVVGCWLASGLTQLWQLATRVFAQAGAPHALEVPGEQPERVLAILDACRALVRGPVVLGIAGPGDPTQLFLHYRLAYELYPVRVASESGPDALAKLSARGAEFVLVMGGSDAAPPDARIVARPAPGDVLLRR
jgi:hypothetical protein